MTQTTTRTKSKLEADQRAEQEAIERQKRQNEVELQLKNSFPAKLKQLLQGACVVDYEGVSDATRKACAAQREFVDSITAQLDGNIRELAKALSEAADSGAYSDVFNALEMLKIDKTAMAQQTVQAWATASDLAAKVVADLTPLAAKLQADAESVVSKVKEELTKIGSGVEAQQAHGKYAVAADRQLDHLARYQNIRSRAAIAAVAQAREAFQAASEKVGQAQRGLAAARQFLHDVVLKQVNG